MTLTGQDAINFNNAMLNPSRERIIESRSQMRRIQEQIQITPTDSGFNAEIADLDLSDIIENKRM